MDRDTARRNFVRDNFGLLLEKPVNEKAIKERKFQYFKKRLKGGGGFPRNTEIAREICEYCVETGHAKKMEDLDNMINEAPFLDKYIYPRDRPHLESLFEHEESEMVVSPEEISEIHRQEFRRGKELEIVRGAKARIEEEIAKGKREVQEEMEARYQDLLEQLQRERTSLGEERAEIERFRSEIDEYAEADIGDIPYVPPSLDTTESHDGMAWWERLGLFGNPFPTVDGLSKIDERYYDEVVLKTKVFQDYHSLVTQMPNELLNKTCLIVGEFGSGKTTLFDYLKKPMITHDILPVSIILDAESDKEAILRSFYRELMCELVPKYEPITGQDPRLFYSEYGKQELHDMMKVILTEKSLEGIVLIIDGLHKNESEIKAALGFIRMLQNPKDFWVRKGLDVGILVAGSKAWVHELSQDSSMRGSINRTDKIQEITANEAHDMISKRLRTFSVDQDKPTQVRKPVIERAYEIMKRRFPREITFRDIVEEIMPYLERKHRGYVEISLPFDQELLEKMRSEIKKHPEVAKSIEVLRGRPDAFVPALQVLSLALERKRVKENSKLFKENTPIFAMLRGAALIQKAREKDGKGFLWIPSKASVKFGYEMEKQFGMKPSHFMGDLFQDREEESVSSPAEADEMSIMRSLTSSHRASDPVLAKALEVSLERYSELAVHAESVVDKIPRGEILTKTSEAVDSTLEVLFLSIESRGELMFLGKTSHQWLAGSWIQPSEVMEFWNEADRLEGKLLSREESAELTRSSIRALRRVARLVEEMLRVNSVVNLSDPDLRTSDKRVFHSIRSAFASGKYFDSCRQLTDYMEQALRTFLFDVFRLKYDGKWRARLGQEVNDYIENQRTRSKTKLPPTHESMNDLYHCTRQHYGPIMTEVQGNWEQVFRFCFGDETKSYVSDAIDLLFAFSTKDKHNVTEEYLKTNSDKLLLSIQQSSRILAAMNRTYALLISPENVFVKESENEVHMYFSFMDFGDESNLKKLVIKRSQIKTVWQRIKNGIEKSGPSVDLADHDQIEFTFRTKYDDLIGVLACAISQGALRIQRISGSSVVLELGDERDASCTT